MRLSKWQTAIITLLNVIIATLVIVIAVTGRGTANGGADGTPSVPDAPTVTDPEHVKLRDAAAGLVPEIERETRLMGSGDETAVNVFFRGGVTYIFGNATVADYDFDSYGGFLCVVNGAGTILSFTYYDGRIYGVCDYGAGYVVAAGRKLYRTEYTGEKHECAAFDGDALDVFCADGGDLSAKNGKIALVTQPTPNSLKLTEYSFTGDKLNSGRSTSIYSGYTVKYFDCYDFGGSYVISARVYSLPRYDSLAFYSFAAGGDATVHYFGGDVSLSTPYAVMPFSAGYFAVASINGVAAILSVDYSFTSFHSVTLGFTCTAARLLYADNKYYACHERGDGAVCYTVEPDLKREQLDLGGMSVGFATKLGVTALAGKSNDGATIRYGSDVLELGIKDPVFYGMTVYEGNVIAVLSAIGGDALSAPSGNRDVYVVTIKGGAIGL